MQMQTTQRRARIAAFEMPFAEGLRVDERLAALGRGHGATRLRIGEGLLRLEAAGGAQMLGFPTFESYCREALERSGRWGADVRSLARRLRSLPRLRAALARGRLGAAMVELLARVATAEDEEAWIEEAARSTVRAMRLLVNAAPDGPSEEDERPARVTIVRTVDRIDAWAFERARLMLEAVGVDGGPGGDGAIEAMLAEALTELMARGPVELSDDLGTRAGELTRAWRAELARLREQGEAAVEVALLACRETDADRQRPDDPDEVDDEDGEQTPEAIDAALRAAARTLAQRDLELGELARRCDATGLWRRLGYVSFEQYCRERIGLSPSAIATRVALVRRVNELPEVAAAVIDGHIGYEAASLVSRVAGPTTAAAWVERASQRTVKHLREEIAAVELFARAEGRRVQGTEPPDADTLRAAHEVERHAIAVVTGQMSVTELAEADEVDAGQMSGTEQLPVATTTLNVRMSEDLARLWREVEALHLSLAVGSFVAFLVRAVMKAWAGACAERVAYDDVYLRDRWRCSSPVCASTNVTPHHLRFRSRGGGEERENLASLCARCHLDLVHAQKLEVTRVGEELQWQARGWRVQGRVRAAE